MIDSPFADGGVVKTCRLCGVAAPLDSFHKDKRSKDGHCSACKTCACMKTRQWVKENADRARDASKEWAKRNPDARNAIRRRSYANHLEVHRAYNRAKNAERRKRPEFREANRVNCAEWYEKNKERVLKQQASHYHANRDVILERESRHSKELTDKYVLTALHVPGQRGQVPSELIEMKREQLRLHRLAKEMKQAINQR